MKNLKSFLIIAALTLVTTSANVSFANKVKIKKVDSCTATASRTVGGITYRASATRSTCADAGRAASAMLPQL